MSLHIRFANHSFRHFFIRDIEGHRDGSYLFRDCSPYPFADGDPEAVQGKPIGEQGDEGFFGTSCVSSHQERSCP